MIKVKCDNADCENEWNYKGKNKFYACCSMCHKQIRLVKDKEDEEK